MSSLIKKALELVVGPSETAEPAARAAAKPRAQHAKDKTNSHAPKDANSKFERFSKPLFSRPLQSMTERQLIQLESEIGATLFGELPENTVQRRFFNLDPSTWVWYEETVDAQKKIQSATVRYEVQPNGILKAQGGARYSYLEGAELDNFLVAVQTYYERVAREVYKRDPVSGQAII